MNTLVSPEKRAAVQAALAEDPTQMTMQLARRLEVPEGEVIRLMPDDRSVELDPARWEELFNAFEELGDVHVIVSNGSVTCETVGRFGGFSTWGEFFNVQSSSLDMHIRWGHLASIFAVIKPGHLDGGRTLSIQFFDRRGDSAMKVFLNFGGRPSSTREQQFDRIRERFRL